MSDSSFDVDLAKITTVWLDREATIDKVVEWIEQAAAKGYSLVACGEALLPGYPFWVERTDGAQFDFELQKSLYAHYASRRYRYLTVTSTACRLPHVRTCIGVYLGIIERANDRGDHSL